MVVPVRITSSWEVLLLQRGPEKGGVWQPVTGNVEPGEDIGRAAEREFDEETGLGGRAALRPTGYIHRFEKGGRDGPREYEEHVYVAVVRMGANVQLSHEHVGSRWMPVEQALKAVGQDGVRTAVAKALDTVGAHP
jgi:lipoyl(octanoyl) transferase